MPNYKNSKIYCIRSYQTDKVYIGSTTYKYLCTRMAIHKNNYKNYLNGSRLYTSFKMIKYPDAYIELLEQYPCNSREELNRREGSYIRKINCVNKNIAGRTRKQYKIDNAEKIKRYDRQYYIDNVEKIKKYNKRYKIDNADTLKRYSRQYYIDNADTLRKKTFCTVCCGSYTHKHKAQHIKSKKHNDMCLNKLFKLP